MKWVFRIIALILVAFVAAMALGFTREPNFHIERSAQIDAQAYHVFPYMNDLRTFEQWSPWREFGNGGYVVAGPSSGEGQELAWKTDDSTVGTGSQIIIESFQDSFVRSELNFSGRSAVGTYAIEPLDGAGVSVLISLETDLGGFPFVQRVFTGALQRKTEDSFDRALNDLKRLSEADAAADIDN